MRPTFNRDIYLHLFASGLVGFCLFGGMYSLLFNLYLLRLGYGPAFVGQVNAVGGLAFALSSLPSSWLGGRWGNRRTMIVGLGLAVVGHALLSQAEFVPDLYRQRFIFGANSLGLLGISLYTVNGYPYLMAVASPAQRHRVFSLQAALFPLAGFAGSLVGGFLPGGFASLLQLSLDHPTPYRHTLLSASLLLIPGVLALVATSRQPLEHHEDAPTEATPLPLKLILILSIISFLYTGSEVAVRTFLNVYLDDALHASTALIGTLAAGGQLLAAPAALMMPLLVRRFGHTRTFNGAVLCSAVVVVPLALVPHWAVAGLCLMGTMCLSGIRRPAFTIFQQERVPLRWRTAMAGAAATMTGFGYAGVALGGGYMIEAVGYRALFLIAGCLSAAGVAVFWLCFRRG